MCPHPGPTIGRRTSSLDTLDDGQRVTIAFPRDEEACLHDLKVLYVDGEEAEWSGMNLCETSVIGLRYDRRTGEDLGRSGLDTAVG
jgi:hypothetical protein